MVLIVGATSLLLEVSGLFSNRVEQIIFGGAFLCTVDRLNRGNG